MSNNYQGLEQLGTLCKGIHLTDKMGLCYLACKPGDKPNDPMLNPPLKAMWVCDTFGRQFLDNLDIWHNGHEVILRLYTYLSDETHVQQLSSKAIVISHLARQMEQRNLLIFPLD